MTNTIDIMTNWRAIWNGQQFALERFDEGGREVRNPATGENVLSQAKWVNQECYSVDIVHLVEKVIKVEVAEKATDLRNFLKLYRKYRASLRSMLEGS